MYLKTTGLYLLYFAALSLTKFQVLASAAEDESCVATGGEGDGSSVCDSSQKATKGNNDGYYDSWDSILSSSVNMIGQAWPPNDKIDSKDNCMLLLTHSFLMRHCPEFGEDGKMTYGAITAFHYEQNARYRGAFTVPSVHHKYRLWVLSSPGMKSADLLVEYDLNLGRVVQILRLPGVRDCHDAVRLGDRVFVADTNSGDILELALPTPATENEALNAKFHLMDQDAQIRAAKWVQPLKRHHGLNRADHVNNIGIHKDLILTSLHGSDSLIPKTVAAFAPSRTRHTMIPRFPSPSSSTSNFDPLYYDKNSDLVIDSAGAYCHGIGFFKDKETSEIKLITLDSKVGSLVSVVIGGGNSSSATERKKEVLWTPDLTHPILERKGRYKDMVVFAKAIALQGGVVFFCVSGARRPMDRTRNFSVLVVAYDLLQKKELWVEVVESSGLINQIATMGYLNTGCGDDDEVCFEWPDNLDEKEAEVNRVRKEKGETFESGKKAKVMLKTEGFANS